MYTERVIASDGFTFIPLLAEKDVESGVPDDIMDSDNQILPNLSSQSVIFYSINI